MFMNSEDFRRILEERTEMDIRSAFGRGKDEGRVEGKAEGLAEGLEKGEAKAHLEMALGMLKKGIGLDTIAELTGLNQDALTALRAQQS